MLDPTLQERAEAYAKKKGLVLNLLAPLGHGQDGSVWRSDRSSAVKALHRHAAYTTELECYQRFRRQRLLSLNELAVPVLMDWDDSLQVIEMRIVKPPYILDFAKAWLDRPADYSRETMADWDDQGRELFEANWPKVLALLRKLQSFGIYYYDAKPANIRFAE